MYYLAVAITLLSKTVCCHALCIL